MNSSRPSNYRIEIDGLRAFAVLSVVAFHAFPSLFVGGFIGVDIFFVISGFLITGHIFEKLDVGEFNFIDFFQRRIRRIFPSLIVVMFASLLFGWFTLLADEYAQLGKHIASGVTFISNFIFANEVGYFDSAAELKPMLHLWSLSVEEQFYILWPLTLWVASKRSLNIFSLTLLAFVASFLTNIIWVHTNPAETFFWPFGRFWEMLSGSLLAWFLVPKKRRLATHQVFYFQKSNIFQKALKFFESPIANTFFSLAGFFLLLIGIFVINKKSPFPSYWALLPTIGTLLIINAGSQNFCSKIIFSNRLAVWFGLISYPLYLWHWPILSFLHILKDGSPHRDSKIAAVSLSIFLAWITYRFIELPIRFGRLKEPNRTISLIAAMTLVGFAGLIAYITDCQGSRTASDVLFRTKSLEKYSIGSSNRWYEGNDNWLFLGNENNRIIEKLTQSIHPDPKKINALYDSLLKISETAALTNTRVALLIGPNKSSIYPEYLPNKFRPAKKRYLSFFTEDLSSIPNFTLHDPTTDFLKLKESVGYLYWRTDSHWNEKGAFLAYEGLAKKMNLPVPNFSFGEGPPFRGALIDFSGLENYPLYTGDNWITKNNRNFTLKRQEIQTGPLSDAFGPEELVTNSAPLSNLTVWVIGDSFTERIKLPLEATFKEIHYLGHWSEHLQNLPNKLLQSPIKPDLIIIVRVERSF